jgi:leucyl-tRNA synthetase
VLHLLYARFWHKVFYELGLVSTSEPFRRLFNQGMLTAPAYKDRSGRRIPADEVVPREGSWIRQSTGEEVVQFTAQMAKSLRNVINPDHVIAEHGADAFRLYEMFMAPLADSRTWDPRGIAGCRRFLERLWKLLVDPQAEGPVRSELLETGVAPASSRERLELERALNAAIRRVDESFEQFNFNTAIAAMMTFVNEAHKRPGALNKDQAERLLSLLSPFAPHIAEELWRRLGHERSISEAAWPEVDEAFLEVEEYELVVQVLGRIRGRARAPRSASEQELTMLARRTVARHLEGREIVRTIVVPGRLVNFVIR